VSAFTNPAVLGALAQQQPSALPFPMTAQTESSDGLLGALGSLLEIPGNFASDIGEMARGLGHLVVGSAMEIGTLGRAETDIPEILGGTFPGENLISGFGSDIYERYLKDFPMGFLRNAVEHPGFLAADVFGLSAGAGAIARGATGLRSGGVLSRASSLIGTADKSMEALRAARAAGMLDPGLGRTLVEAGVTRVTRPLSKSLQDSIVSLRTPGQIEADVARQLATGGYVDNFAERMTQALAGNQQYIDAVATAKTVGTTARLANKLTLQPASFTMLNPDTFPIDAGASRYIVQAFDHRNPLTRALVRKGYNRFASTSIDALDQDIATLQSRLDGGDTLTNFERQRLTDLKKAVTSAREYRVPTVEATWLSNFRAKKLANWVASGIIGNHTRDTQASVARFQQVIAQQDPWHLQNGAEEIQALSDGSLHELTAVDEANVLGAAGFGDVTEAVAALYDETHAKRASLTPEIMQHLAAKLRRGDVMPPDGAIYSPPVPELLESPERVAFVERMRAVLDRTGMPRHQQVIGLIPYDASALAAVRSGKYATVGEFYDAISPRFEELWNQTVDNTLNQVRPLFERDGFFERVFNTALADEATAREMAQWYDLSHQALSEKFAGKLVRIGVGTPNEKVVTLTELMENVIAATSFNEATPGNMSKALKVIENYLKVGPDRAIEGLGPLVDELTELAGGPGPVTRAFDAEGFNPSGAGLPEAKFVLGKMLREGLVSKDWYRIPELQPYTRRWPKVSPFARALGGEDFLVLDQRMREMFGVTSADDLDSKVMLLDGSIVGINSTAAKTARRQGETVVSMRDMVTGWVDQFREKAQRMMPDLRIRMADAQAILWGAYQDILRNEVEHLKALFARTSPRSKAGRELKADITFLESKLKGARPNDNYADLLDMPNRAAAVDRLMSGGDELRPPKSVERAYQSIRARLFKRLGQETLHQQVEARALGSITFGDSFDIVVRFAKDADFSTLVHEGGHLLRRSLPEDIRREVNAAFDVVEPDAEVMGSITDRVRQQGGLSVKVMTGDEPTAGFMVARRGTSRILKDADFFDEEVGVEAVMDYLRKHGEDLENNWLGIWHDKKNGEVVFDVADNVADRDEAIRLGRERNQQAIWDVEQADEIDTGGTGDRDAPDAGVQAPEAGLPDDGGGAPRVREEGRPGDEVGEPAGVAAAPTHPSVLQERSERLPLPEQGSDLPELAEDVETAGVLWSDDGIRKYLVAMDNIPVEAEVAPGIYRLDAKAVAERLHSDPDGQYYGYWENGNLVGLAGLRGGDDLTTWVDAAYRRRGIATRIYDGMEADGVPILNITGTGIMSDYGYALASKYLERKGALRGPQNTFQEDLDGIEIPDEPPAAARPRPGNVIDVPIDWILRNVEGKPNEIRTREGLSRGSADRVERAKRSLQRGWDPEEPASLYVGKGNNYEGGDYELTDGTHRLLAARELGMETVPVEVIGPLDSTNRRKWIERTFGGEKEITAGDNVTGTTLGRNPRSVTGRVVGTKVMDDGRVRYELQVPDQTMHEYVVDPHQAIDADELFQELPPAPPTGEGRTYGWTREKEERFARAFEQYIFNRITAEPGMTPAFEQLRQTIAGMWNDMKPYYLSNEIIPIPLAQAMDAYFADIWKGMNPDPGLLRPPDVPMRWERPLNVGDLSTGTPVVSPFPDVESAFDAAARAERPVRQALEAIFPRSVQVRVKPLNRAHEVAELTGAVPTDMLGARVTIADWKELEPTLQKLQGAVAIIDKRQVADAAGRRSFTAVIDVDGMPVEVQIGTAKYARTDAATSSLAHHLQRDALDVADAQQRLALGQDSAGQPLTEAMRGQLEAYIVKKQRDIKLGNYYLQTLWEPVTDEIAVHVLGERPPGGQARQVWEELRLVAHEELTLPLIDLLGDKFSPASVFERTYLPLRIKNGAKWEIVDANGEQLGDFVGGASAEELHIQRMRDHKMAPIYFPHIDVRRMHWSDMLTAHSRIGARKSAAPKYALRNKGDLFAADFYEKDMLKAYSNRAGKALRYRDTLAIVQEFTDRFARRIEDVTDLNPETEQLFAPDGMLAFFNAKIGVTDQLLADIGDALDLDPAEMLANEGFARVMGKLQKQVLSVTKRGVKLYAMPKHAVDQFERLFRVSGLETPARLFFDQPMKVWRSLVLTGSPRWIVNNAIGNQLFLKMQGGRLTDVLRQAMPGFRNMINELFPDPATQRAVQTSFTQIESDHVMHLGYAANNPIGAAEMKVAEKWAKSRWTKLPRKYSEWIKRINNAVENAYRNAGYITALERQTGQRLTQDVARRFWLSKQKLDSMAARGIDPATAARALDEVNYFFNDYTRLGHLERQVIRRYIAPFYSFYKHVAKLALTYPINYAGRATVFRAMTQLANDMERDGGPRPEFLSGAVALFPGGDPGSMIFSGAAGPNPFSALAQSPLALLAPPWKVAFEYMTGRSTFTGRAFTDPDVIYPYGSEQGFRVIKDGSGKVVNMVPVDKVAPGLGEMLLQQVPQYNQLRNLAAGGRTYDTTSLVEALTGGAPRQDSAGNTLAPYGVPEAVAQYLGLPTFEYNLLDYQTNFYELQQQALAAYLKREAGAVPTGV
jgi:hypothetical protein